VPGSTQVLLVQSKQHPDLSDFKKNYEAHISQIVPLFEHCKQFGI